MAKGQSKKVARLAAKVQEKAQEQVQHAAQAAAPLFGQCVVVVGGSLDKPVKSDLAIIPAVQADEIARYGTDARRVRQGLAANILAGVPLSRDVLSKSSPCWAERSVRQEKMAFFGLLDLTATGKMTRAALAEAWSLSLKERKRYDAPTLQALYKAAREYLILSGAVEQRVSPMAKFARAILEVINNRTLSSDERLAQIRTKMEEKAEWPEVVSEKIAASK